MSIPRAWIHPPLTPWRSELWMPRSESMYKLVHCVVTLFSFFPHSSKQHVCLTCVGGTPKQLLACMDYQFLAYTGIDSSAHVMHVGWWVNSLTPDYFWVWQGTRVCSFRTWLDMQVNFGDCCVYARVYGMCLHTFAWIMEMFFYHILWKHLCNQTCIHTVQRNISCTSSLKLWCHCVQVAIEMAVASLVWVDEDKNTPADKRRPARICDWFHFQVRDKVTWQESE